MGLENVVFFLGAMFQAKGVVKLVNEVKKLNIRAQETSSAKMAILVK